MMRHGPFSTTSTRPSGSGWQACTSVFSAALYSQTIFLSRVISIAPCAWQKRKFPPGNTQQSCGCEQAYSHSTAPSAATTATLLPKESVHRNGCAAESAPASARNSAAARANGVGFIRWLWGKRRRQSRPIFHDGNSSALPAGAAPGYTLPPYGTPMASRETRYRQPEEGPDRRQDGEGNHSRRE